MNSGEEPRVFPYGVIWEEFTPEQEITWEWLEGKSGYYQILFSLPEIGDTFVPAVNHDVFRDLAREALGRDPTEQLVNELYLLAGWQVTGNYWKQIGIDLRSQRSVLERLEKAAFALWEAENQISGHVRMILPILHRGEPDRLLPQGHELNISDVGSAAYDIALVAGRAYEDTRAARTGRDLEMRRDTTVRLGAEAIGRETNEPIKASRGNNAKPAPHFTNRGGRLLRDFFKLLEPKTDERLIVQSLMRVRKRTKLQQNSR